MEKKAKVPICPRCGYGMGIRWKQKLCKACLDAEGNTSAKKDLQAVKKQICPQVKSEPRLSEARTTGRKPKPKRHSGVRPKSVRSPK